MGDPERIGVYGGTFDPIHRTHLDVARAAMQHAGLDRVIYVVAGTPPHKRRRVNASAEDRFAMVKAALAAEPAMEVSRIEVDREGPSYTVDTLRQLQAEHPGARLYLIVGSDSLADLPGWRDPEGIVTLARLLVVPRPGARPVVPPPLEGHVDIVPFAQSDTSSTWVRRNLGQRGWASELPDAVQDIIRAKGLYDEDP